jgi:hypothetical protein
MKDPRTIVVKTLLNPDEFVALREECEAADVTHSKLLRDLAKGWLAERNSRRRSVGVEWPSAGQNLSMLLPGRTNYGASMHLRRRL